MRMSAFGDEFATMSTPSPEFQPTEELEERQGLRRTPIGKLTHKWERLPGGIPFASLTIDIEKLGQSGSQCSRHGESSNMRKSI
jgi:hypothetical protein